MIARLRSRHRLMTCVLAVVVPVVFAAGILARESVPVHEGSAAAERPQTGEILWESADAWGDLGIRTRVFLPGEGASAHVLELAPAADFQQPDVLVYWSERAPQVAEGVPTGAILLGRLAGAQVRRYELPGATAGHVILYSLAHQESVGTARIGAPEQGR